MPNSTTTTPTNEFSLSVQLLKNTITRAVQNALENFENDTGVTPTAIEVRMVQASEDVHILTRHVLKDVVVRFRG